MKRWKSFPRYGLFHSASRVIFWLLGGTVALAGLAVLVFWVRTGLLPTLTIGESFARDAFGLTAGVGAAVGLVANYRGQKSAVEVALTDRYSRAAEHMGA